MAGYVCNAETDNGIEYVTVLYSSNMEYKRIVNTLDTMAKAVGGIYAGTGTTQAYTIGNRSKTNSQLSPSDMLKRWDRLWVRKRQLEGGRTPRKTAGVLPRDW